MTQPIKACFEALLGSTPNTAEVVLEATAARSVTLEAATSLVLEREELESELGRGKAPDVVVVEQWSQALQRKLSLRPPSLLVVTGHAPPGFAQNLPVETRTLGPHARLRVRTEGSGVVCAGDADELNALVEGADSPCGPRAIELCPTPSWLPEILGCEPEGRLPWALGFVPATALGLAWMTATMLARDQDLLVPLGVQDIAVHEAEGSALEALVAAHSLESRTGPLFPEPALLWALKRARAATPATTGESLEANEEPVLSPLWTQAQRALPELARSPGMARPCPELRSIDPRVAFLAQAALYQARAPVDSGSDSELPEGLLELDLSERSWEVLRAAPEQLTEHESKVVLKGAGFEITRQAVAGSASAAAQFADRIGYPVAMKVLSPDLRRKSDIGALFLNVGNAASARRAYADILNNVETHQPEAHVDGVVVAEMVAEGLELRCGAVRLRKQLIALYVQPIGLAMAVPSSWGVTNENHTTAIEAVRRLADATLRRLPYPSRRRGSDPSVETLCEVLLRLRGLMFSTGDRIDRIDLSPMRLVEGDRGHVVLDASLLQQPHLEGE